MFGEILYNQDLPAQANCGYLLQALPEPWQDFQRLPSNSWAYGFTKELEAYAFPDGTPVAEPCPVTKRLETMNKLPPTSFHFNN
jgi:hypothetical protein